MYSTPTTILKCDALGRIGYTRGQRDALLDEFERSGLKGAAFARMVGISYPTLANWIQKRRIRQT
jgi:transposase